MRAVPGLFVGEKFPQMESPLVHGKQAKKGEARSLACRDLDWEAKGPARPPWRAEHAIARHIGPVTKNIRKKRFFLKSWAHRGRATESSSFALF